jgi:hypothetical protein
MLIQILWPTSNRPLGVNILISGGLKADHQLQDFGDKGMRGRHTVLAGEHDEAMVFSSMIGRIRWSSLDNVSSPIP